MNQENNISGNEELDNIIHLTDENGNNMTFEFLDVIEYEANEYIVLLPVDDGDEAPMVIILKVVDAPNESEETYVGEEDPNILNAVYHIFKEKFKNEFDFID